MHLYNSKNINNPYMPLCGFKTLTNLICPYMPYMVQDINQKTLIKHKNQ